MEYRDPREALTTREENGFRVSVHDETHRFPSDAALKEAIAKINDVATNHKMRPCPAGQECVICFLTKASAESQLLEVYAEAMFHKVLGKRAHEIAEYQDFFSVAFFFLMIGMEVMKGQGNQTAEIEMLNKLFNTPPPDPNKPASGDGIAAA
jgi:hypothetical protein